MVQSRHLNSLKVVIESDLLQPKLRKDLMIIYDTIKGLIKKGNNKKEESFIEEGFFDF